jgi:general secretion pathway protein D
LKVQNRIDILSRPQVTTLDNQTANILVGRSVPYSTGSNITGTGIISNSVSYRDTGVLMNVTPRISPDGRVLMRVQPEVSKVATTSINLGNGVLAPEFDVQSVLTTVACNDGETVVIGGLISKTDNKNENKIPWFGDLPYVGAAFRYRTQAKTKTELLVILTPHVVRSRADADRVLAEEARRMDWITGDVIKMQGTSGMEAIMPPPGGVDGRLPPGAALPGAPAPAWPAPPVTVPVYPAAPAYPSPDGQMQLPLPRVMPQAQPVVPAPGPQAPAPAGPAVGDPTGRAVPQQPMPAQAAPAQAAVSSTDQRQEVMQWTVPPRQ